MSEEMKIRSENASENSSVYPLRGADEKLELFLERVHEWATMYFEYEPDADHYQVPERWPTEAEIIAQLEAGIENKAGMVKGDCDDFAYLCHYALKANGLPSDLVLCWVAPGRRPEDYHMVCHINGYVLDSRCHYVTLAYLLREGCPEYGLQAYEWDKIGSGDTWYEAKEKLSTWS